MDIRNENGEIDYKKLYEEQLVENDRLKEKLRKSDEELRETKQTLERINVVVSLSLSHSHYIAPCMMIITRCALLLSPGEKKKLKIENDRSGFDVNRKVSSLIETFSNK